MVEDVYLEDRKIPFGPLVFNGHVDVRFEVVSPAAVPELDPTEGVAWLGSGGGSRGRSKACQHIALRRMGRTR